MKFEQMVKTVIENMERPHFEVFAKFHNDMEKILKYPGEYDTNKNEIKHYPFVFEFLLYVNKNKLGFIDPETPTTDVLEWLQMLKNLECVKEVSGTGYNALMFYLGKCRYVNPVMIRDLIYVTPGSNYDKVWINPNERTTVFGFDDGIDSFMVENYLLYESKNGEIVLKPHFIDSIRMLIYCGWNPGYVKNPDDEEKEGCYTVNEVRLKKIISCYFKYKKFSAEVICGNNKELVVKVVPASTFGTFIKLNNSGRIIGCGGNLLEIEGLKYFATQTRNYVKYD